MIIVIIIQVQKNFFEHKTGKNVKGSSGREDKINTFQNAAIRNYNDRAKGVNIYESSEK
ncbi:MAG: hypothetical protein Q7J35_05935 [Candidatus Methanoperedens sp.]|nr:hypothetical protein [Candidatus Methanoperedens sp.]